MAKVDDSTQRKFIPVIFQSQVQPGTFGFTLPRLIENKVVLPVFEKHYRDDETVAPACNPALLFEVILPACSSRAMAAIRPAASAFPGPW